MGDAAKTWALKILRTQNCRRKFIKNLLLKNAKKICKPNNRD